MLSLTLAIAGLQVKADETPPNPYLGFDNWATLPQGRSWGEIIGVEVDRDGESIWVLDRCGAKDCFRSTIDPIQKFDRSGRFVKSFGGGLFNWPHGLFVDREGNVWTTDGIGTNGKGNTVFKFSSEGKLLLTLGRPGVAGRGRDTFNWPSDVLVAPNGDIFVADGHGNQSNARIVKFDKNGQYLKEWGQAGSAVGEFDTPHGLAMDSRGRLFVADRANNRIQAFDQEGAFLFEWTQFGRPSGLCIDLNDMLYVADSQSDNKTNQTFEKGIRIGHVGDGKVTAFIRGSDNNSAPESLAVDAHGNIFAGFIEMQTLRRYVRR